MNFKRIAIAASLIAAATSSFAVDIDLGGAGVISTPATAVADFLGAVPLDAALTLGDANDNNVAIIVQDDVNATGLENIAYIDQVGITGGLAAILQSGGLAANVAYIAQVATTNARAVITQR